MITDIPRLSYLAVLGARGDIPDLPPATTYLAVGDLLILLPAAIPVFAPVVLFVASCHVGLH